MATETNTEIDSDSHVENHWSRPGSYIKPPDSLVVGSDGEDIEPDREEMGPIGGPIREPQGLLSFQPPRFR